MHLVTSPFPEVTSFLALVPRLDASEQIAVSGELKEPVDRRHLVVLLRVGGNWAIETNLTH